MAKIRTFTMLHEGVKYLLESLRNDKKMTWNSIWDDLPTPGANCILWSHDKGKMFGFLLEERMPRKTQWHTEQYGTINNGIVDDECRVIAWCYDTLEDYEELPPS